MPNTSAIADTGKAVRTKVARSIHDIDANDWDSILSCVDSFHRHSFLACVEDARVENGTFRYVTVYRGNVIIGTAALSSLIVSLDIFTGGFLRRAITAVQKIYPQFLKIRVLFCGIPVSLGQKNIVVRSQDDSAIVFDAVAGCMENIAKEDKTGYLCFKEFYKGDSGPDRLGNHGYFRAHSIPYVILDISWKGFDAYLNSFRHGYRRQINATLRKYAITDPWQVSATAREGMPLLKIDKASLFSPSLFHELYLQVMNRAQMKLEVLNGGFFNELFQRWGDALDVISLEKNGSVFGAALVTEHGGEMTFLLIGMDYSMRDDYDTYFILVYAIVGHAIRKGCRRLNLGQTSYPLKQRIGGKGIHEYHWFRVRNPFVHMALNAFRSLIFPRVDLKPLQVFKDATAGL
ncbi:MAG: hypothetical protein A2509_01750 [Candidatus Edwardsbacteria bacterium RIFOXYD12_FULL_50_11]|nr:MAG: hypothetical protein A2502_03075 [Candidatus Edwardsbacteria bacterium RifOxyC12_full_54_24]OGF16310.1 MAG: hypothetical protein A2509_01750 [Candidatus Edwardsbacteria bacterium RIFOXYD12_FULL_50_11]OGJ19363.1 MAG: hypothetical protein A2349_09070 [Candidatus Edwardsbacteria bacterium RifOxyB12_full_52_30]